MYIILLLIVISILIYRSKYLELDKIPSVSKTILKYMKIFAIFNAITAILMVTDFVIPKEVVEGSVINDGDIISVQFSNYEDELRTVNNELFDDGESVKIGLTRIFQEVFYVESNVTDTKINFAMEDIKGYLAMIIFFILPIMFYFVHEIKSSRMKMSHFMLATVNSIGALISLIIWVKLILVHILGFINRV